METSHGDGSIVAPADTRTAPTDAAIAPTDAAIAPTDAAIAPTDAAIASADTRIAASADTATGPADAAVARMDARIASVDTAIGPADAAVARTDARIASADVAIRPADAAVARTDARIASADVAIDVEGLRMRYGAKDVLHEVGFQGYRGEVVALLGPNGAGKSTTIEILEGFRMRSAGRVTVLGLDPAHATEQWRSRIGIVLQSWRDHGKWRVRELLAHQAGYYAPRRRRTAATAKVMHLGYTASYVAKSGVDRAARHGETGVAQGDAEREAGRVAKGNAEHGDRPVAQHDAEHETGHVAKGNAEHGDRPVAQHDAEHETGHVATGNAEPGDRPVAQHDTARDNPDVAQHDRGRQDRSVAKHDTMHDNPRSTGSTGSAAGVNSAANGSGGAAWEPDTLLEAVGLTAQANQRIGTLSGGQRRRLDVAMGIVGQPEVLFLDEPTAGFDPQARREFHDLVRGLATRHGTAVLLTTHDLDEAERLADRIVILDDGRIVADGTANELAQRVAGLDEVRWTLDGQRFTEASADSTRFAFELFRRHGEAVHDLEIRKSSLEDVYLTLVRRAEGPAR